MVRLLLLTLLPLFLFGTEICTLSFKGFSGNVGLLKCRNLKPVTYRVDLSNGKEVRSFLYSYPNNIDYLPFAVPFFWSGNITLTFYREGFKLARVNFKVEPLSRGISRLKVSYKTDTKRVSRDYSLIRKVLRTYSPVRYYESRPLFPLEFFKRISSPYGVRRFVNGKPAGFHKGVDFAAPYGGKIFAVLSGKVILARKLALTGNTIVIDHGWGLMTLYAHLSRIEIKEGEFVKQGEVIGRVGSSGRSTGPHLHFGVYLNDIAIDPLNFLKTGLRPAKDGN